MRSGKYRTKDRFAGMPIDASGELPDGTALNGPDDLRKALLRSPDQFVQTLTEKLMTYALGRTLEYTDMPTVRAIVRDERRRRLPVRVPDHGHRHERTRSRASGRLRRRRSSKRRWHSAADGTVAQGHVEELLMFITRKHLSRRTVLRGAGAVDRPAAARRDDSGGHRARRHRRRRRSRAWASSTSRTARSWTAGSRKQPAPISSFRRSSSRSSPSASTPRSSAACATRAARAPTRTGSSPAPGCRASGPSDPRSHRHRGVTADQLAAQHIGQDTALPSLELAVEAEGGLAAHPAWAAVSRAPSHSARRRSRCRWRTTRARFSTSCSGRATPPRSALRSSTETRQHARSRAGEGAAPRAASSVPRTGRCCADYLDSVREIERRVQKSARAAASSDVKLPDAPLGDSGGLRRAAEADVRA